MKIFALLLFIASALAQHEHEVRTRFFNQPLDHFNPFNRRNWDQRFLENSQFFQEGGPIFIYTTLGEGLFGVYDDWIKDGLVHEIAQELNGMLIAIEHRYYGVSRPTPDTSIENLQWLNLQQSLADIARFIAHYKENNYGTENSRVILWGRGYGGSLAIWARQKYPFLVDGAWGSSAPLHAELEYSQVLLNMYNTIIQVGGPECGDVVFGAFSMIEEAANAGNTTHVEQTLRLCHEIDIGNAYDLARIDYEIAESSMYFLQNARYPDIDDKCTIMRGLDTPDDPPANALEGFARWWINDLHPDVDCFDFRNAEQIALYADPEWESVSTIDGRRQKMWLRCTQLGIFPVTNEGTDHPYGRRFEINFFKRWCAEAFGDEIFRDQWWMGDSIEITNEIFGGRDPKAFRILMTHGEFDPMRTLGPSEDLNDQARVITISLESFSRDMNSTNASEDYPHLLEVKGEIRAEILRWIETAPGDHPTPPPLTTVPPIAPGN